MKRRKIEPSESPEPSDEETHDEEEYDENADEDFNPEQPGADGEDASSSSSDEEENTQSAQRAAARKPKNKKGRKRKSGAGDVTVIDELDSGDEATIEERKRKKQRKANDDDDDGRENGEDDDSAGEGGLIRTRAQRLAEKVERKQRRWRIDGNVTVDVDDIWAELSSVPVGRVQIAPTEEEIEADGESNKENVVGGELSSKDEMITIKRRIEYAGEVTEVEEQVPRSSKAAQQYLAEHPEADPTKSATEQDDELRRPLKRPSMFEPNPTATVKGVVPDKLRPRAPNRLDVLLAQKRADEERKKKAERMTTVQKSALDWHGFVDREGLKDELDEYGKSKQGFLAREAFLDRAQWARDSAAREARLKG